MIVHVFRGLSAGRLHSDSFNCSKVNVFSDTKNPAKVAWRGEDGFRAVERDGSPYWDGGLFSNTPLRCAINALETMEPNASHVRRELIAMDCHHIAPSTPRTLSDVIGRLLQIYFFGKLHLDLKLFEQFNTYLDLIEHLDDELPATSPLRSHPAYRKLMAHRKVDRLILVKGEDQESIGAATDFSRASTRARIERGYRDALRAMSVAAKPEDGSEGRRNS
ncbi:MAG: hypothetical protein KGQ57_19060 [Burkholderiales bacterium]|nr:hypothetical protein [Burkholderiales bacterium]